ncbi:nucleolar MIF4G domain-containing protein 1 [Neophocaena asiaeorientalis asiaeorientalis]|uniref:Nucleolar MIF4G domain-containing protein 1 n=1 Tax=Neophocaena asiaeorientalis asiaeorientalis TaxID=1706337 RepID=A0A341B016_NEOAA|nr:nucleolar MIF4G domain-containing protein 1 [Neophocaena asiaeorientalis asiaeorientalis]
MRELWLRTNARSALGIWGAGPGRERPEEAVRSCALRVRRAAEEAVVAGGLCPGATHPPALSPPPRPWQDRSESPLLQDTPAGGAAPRSAPLSSRKSGPDRKSRVGAPWKVAAFTRVAAQFPSGYRGHMARGKRRAGRGPRCGPGGSGEGALKRLKLAVEEFVQATSEGETPGSREGPRAQGRVRPGGRKSRRELRKEKRHLRKARRLQRTAGPAQGELRPPPVPAKAGQAQARGPLGRTKAPAAAARKRALLAANEEEDREIRKLERCLGLNKRRKKGDGSSVPLSFARDGLDYILGALDSGKSSGWYESSSEEEEEDAGQALPEGDSEDEREQQDAEDEGERAADAGAQSEGEDPQVAGAGQLEAGGADRRAKEGGRKKRVRFAEDEDRSESSAEDVDANDKSLCENGGKYIPPHVRREEETVDAQKKEELERLKKQVKGLINRLSEPNLASISGQLEELYMGHSRKDMSDTLTGVLLSACAPDAAMPARLVMEHVLLVSILHCTVGIEVGAHFLEAVVRKFADVYKSGCDGKECDNLFTIIAHLYNFHVVQSLLIFDILRKLIGTFTEKDIELILLMLRNVGFSLRKDDALSLKELITEAQAKASGAGGKFRDQTRVRFMLETLLALKNNDVRKIPGYDPEPLERLRKLQRALLRGAGSGTETQLRVSWDSVLNAERTGRWWIVGSAWSGAPMIDSGQQKTPRKQLTGTVSSKILELARKQRMNTDIRRNIFCTVMTSEDFLDAFEKLLKLGLKDQQEREIVHVLIDCCLQEKTYNPFYAFLAGKLCDYTRSFQMTFQFSIWDKFRDLETLPATNFSNLVHLVAHLLKTKSLPLSILKVVEFSELDKPRVHFLRKVLHMLLMETEVEDLGLIFARVSDSPALGLLREGLKLFISHFLLKGGQAHGGDKEASALRERAELCAGALQGKASLRP